PCFIPHTSSPGLPACRSAPRHRLRRPERLTPTVAGPRPSSPMTPETMLASAGGAVNPEAGAGYDPAVEQQRGGDGLAGHVLDLLALADNPDLNLVLGRILRAARTLVGARYAALGVPDGRGGFARFLTAGISERRAA